MVRTSSATVEESALARKSRGTANVMHVQVPLDSVLMVASIHTIALDLLQRVKDISEHEEPVQSYSITSVHAQVAKVAMAYRSEQRTSMEICRAAKPMRIANSRIISKHVTS